MNNLLFILLFFLSCSLHAQTIKESVYFDFDKFELTNAARTELDELAEKWKGNPASTIKLSGHTDGIGVNQYNDWLAMERTKAVLNYLVDRGVKKEAVQFGGFGENQPVAENNSSSNRAKNRRVEIEFELHETIPPKLEEVMVETPVAAWPPTDGILVKEGDHTYKDALDRNLIQINCVMSTDMMESDMTTQTVDHEALSSNAYLCFKKPLGVTECELKVPLKLYVPSNRKSYCPARKAKIYESTTDSVSGKTVWKEIDKPFTIEVHNGQEYFVFLVTNLCGPCINMDCPKEISKERKLRKRPIAMTVDEVKVEELESNSMLYANKIAPKRWEVGYIRETDQEKPVLHFRVTKVFGKVVLVEAPLDQLKIKRNNYLITRRIIRKYKVL